MEIAESLRRIDLGVPATLKRLQKVRNLSSRLVQVRGVGGRVLTIPPLREVDVTPDDAQWDFQPWIDSQVLVLGEGEPRWPASYLVLGIGFWVLLTSPLVVWSLDLQWRAYIGQWLAYVAFGWMLVRLWERGSLRHPSVLIAQVTSLVAVLIIAVGFPVAFLIFGSPFPELARDMWAERRMGDADLSVEALARRTLVIGTALQTLFLCTAILLPGILFYLFDRNRMQTLRQKITWQIFQLDPYVRAIPQIEAKYGGLVDEIYGSAARPGRSRLRAGSRSPLLVATILISIGWLMTLPPGAPIAAGNIHQLFAPDASVVSFAFLGAYFFALRTILRSYARRDLQPKVYSHISVRILLVFLLAWVIEASGLAQSETLPRGMLYAGGFTIGIFPEAWLIRIQEMVRSGFGLRHVLVGDVQPLTVLEGIDIEERTRLEAEGVTNVEALAHHDLIDLVLNTRIPVPRLVDWVDQAILYVHLSTGETGTLRADLARLRSFGIRTATDLERAIEKAEERGAQARKTLLEALGGGSQTGPCRIEVALDALSDDEWLRYVRNWRRFEEDNQVPLEDPNLLYISCPVGPA